MRHSLLAALVLLACAKDLPDDDSGGDADTDADSDADVAVCQPDNEGFTLTIDNPYFPLPVGQVLVLENDSGSEKVQVTVLDETRTVAGVETRVVEEREWEDDELIEVSRNWFVQTAGGTVCYYGEEVDIYEGGEIVAHEGAWEAGVDGATAGILMPAEPAVGQQYDQEHAVGVAEDHAEITAMGETIEVVAGTFTDTVETDETSPLDGGAHSYKAYARDVGMIIDSGIELQALPTE